MSAVDATTHYTRGFANLISAGSVAATGATTANTEPSQDEVLVVYPSYCRQNDEGKYEVDVRGWLYLPGQPNKRSRMVVATARTIAGVKSDKSVQKQKRTPSSEFAVAEGDTEDEDINTFRREFTEPTKSVSNDQLKNTPKLPNEPEKILKSRLEPFFTWPVCGRTIKITFSGVTDASEQAMLVFEAETNASGRFATLITLDTKPTVVSVEAHELLVTLEKVLYIPPYGVSVISDIDDTIKNTGILGSKRELFRNVFVYEYDQIAIEGVQEWYHAIGAEGAAFHYVSNSPWQLYPTISSYMRSAKFPQGTMHLKEYGGLLNGLFEPASERKKQNLHKILQDFPHRKFVLIGDSGEGDLEAYIDVAKQFPNQVLALYIRDVTMPPDGNLDDETLSSARRNFVPRPDEIDMYDPAAPKRQTWPVRILSEESSEPSLQRQASTMSMNPPLRKPVRPASTTDMDKMTRQEPELAPSLSNVPPSAPSDPNNPYARANPYALHRPSPEPNPYTTATKITSNSTVFETDENFDSSFWHPGWDEEDIPPPLPPRRSATDPTETPSDTTAAPPAQSRFRIPSWRPSSRTPTLTTDTTEAPDNMTETLDKKLEHWKRRVMTARCGLPSDTRLKIWRVGPDALQESVEIVKREMLKQKELSEGEATKEKGNELVSE